MKGVYITGTGTGIGKTTVCGLLAGVLRAQGVRVTTQKWVETGATNAPSDIAVHRRLMGDPGSAPEPPPADRSPYRFALPASPHLAASREGRRVDPAVIEAAYRRLAETHDAVLVEGTGGFLVPLTEDLLAGDLVARIGLPVLVVAANRLGCVNDTLLTVEAVRRRGIPLVGIVFNRLPTAMEGPVPVAMEGPDYIVAADGHGGPGAATGRDAPENIVAADGHGGPSAATGRDAPENIVAADGHGGPSAATGRDAPENIVAADNPRIVARITCAPVLGEVPPLADPARGAEAFAPVGRAFLERWRAT